MSDEISQVPTTPTSPGKQDYWDLEINRLRKMRARFDEEESPQNITFMLGWESLTIVKEALTQANEFSGTNGSAKAIKHICQEYIQHGPRAQAAESLAVKNKIQTQHIEQILDEVGPTKAMEIFNRVFPAYPVPDAPK